MEIEVLVWVVGVFVLMVDVLKGFIVLDIDVIVDEKFVGVILIWVVLVVMVFCVIDLVVDFVFDILVMGFVVMIVEVFVVVDVVFIFIIRERIYGNNNSRYDIFYLLKWIIEILFVIC